MFEGMVNNRPAKDSELAMFDTSTRPGTTADELVGETVAQLAQLPRIIEIKDASGDIARAAQLRAATGDGFRLYSGDDATALDFLAAGGDGCISVLANVAPAACARLQALWNEGRHAEARAAFRLLQPLVSALTLESNPIPVKHALSLMGRMRDEVRLPLCPASAATRAIVAAALADRNGLAQRLEPIDDGIEQLPYAPGRALERAKALHSWQAR